MNAYEDLVIAELADSEVAWKHRALVAESLVAVSQSMVQEMLSQIHELAKEHRRLQDRHRRLIDENRALSALRTGNTTAKPIGDPADTASTSGTLIPPTPSVASRRRREGVQP